MSGQWVVAGLAFCGSLLAVPLLSDAQTAGAARAQQPRLKLTIPVFADAGRIPLDYTCYAPSGVAKTPPLRWDHVPEGRAVACGESTMWGDYHAREAALYVQRILRDEPYLAFFNVGEASRQG